MGLFKKKRETYPGEYPCCANCGAPIEADAEFCMECGKPIAEQTNDFYDNRPPDFGTNFLTNTCPSCGAILDDDAQFCSNCGYVIGNMDLPRCPNCNGVLDAAGVCTQCQTRGISVDPGPNNMLRCKKCGTDLESDASFCVWCGESVTKEKSYDIDIIPDFTCPHCHAIVSPVDEFCPHCGKRISEPVLADPRLCPHCHEIIAPDAEFCPHCGRNTTYPPDSNSPVRSGPTDAERQTAARNFHAAPEL